MNRLQKAANDAAQHIEAKPDSYQFFRCYIPCSDKDKACAAGWFCYYLGYRGGTLTPTLLEAVGMTYGAFQDEWEDLLGGDDALNEICADPDEMARLLRKSAVTFLSDR